MDFLELMNAVAEIATPSYASKEQVSSMDVPFKDTALDSLDVVMCGVYLCDLYGIPAEAAKNLYPATPRELHAFLMAHQTKIPTSVAEALEEIS